MTKTIIQKVTPFLWFDHDAEVAAKFYTSIFKNSKIIDIAYYGKSAAEATGRPEGTVMLSRFKLEGQLFSALNGPDFKFSQAISFLVNCDAQEEVDGLWNRFSEGGKELQCGWLIDKFGVSWQVCSDVLVEMIQDKDAMKSERVMGAMLQMKKIDIQRLRMAYEGR